MPDWGIPGVAVAIVKDDRLSPEMVARGMRLDTEVEPTVFYVGFNMEDGVVGAPAGSRSRNLRQAMSLAINVEDYLRLFLNGRGVPAQSPLPPGIFGYHKDYGAYIEIISFDKLIDDAKRRNKILFDKLGVSGEALPFV